MGDYPVWLFAGGIYGQELSLVVFKVQAFHKGGLRWLLTNLSVGDASKAQRVVEMNRKLWLIEGFFRFLKSGLGF